MGRILPVERMGSPTMAAAFAFLASSEAAT